MDRLITTRTAAELLQVSQRTVHNWIKAESIPYVQLPPAGRNRYRIPLKGLLASLSGNHDLAKQLEELPRAADALGITEEDVEEVAMRRERRSTNRRTPQRTPTAARRTTARARAAKR